MTLLSTNKFNIEINIIFCIFLSILVQKNAIAKDIEMDASISVGGGYSDNIDLDHKNKRSSSYTNVTPEIKFKKEGARLKTLLNYSASGTAYTSESDLNDVQNRLYAEANSELLKNSIFLDLNATVSQQTLGDGLSSSPDGISGSNNLTETYTYAVTPYWTKKWNNYAESTLKYNYDEVNYSSNDFNSDDSSSDTIALNVESGKAFTRYFWGFDYNYQDVSYDKSDNTRSESYKLRLGYHYSRKLDFTLTSGYEDYHDNEGGRRNDSGFGWRTGFVWNPSQRTNLEFELGHRFFGNSYLLDFKHSGRRLTWHFRYDDSITDSRDQVINNNNDRQINPDGTLVQVSNVSEQYYLNRRFTGDVSYSYKKSIFTLGLFDERRYFKDSDAKDEEDIGANLSWNLRLGRRMSMNTQYSWHQLEDAQVHNTQDRNIYSWSLTRQLTPTMSGVVRVSYSDNDADVKSDKYTENAISIDLVKSF